MSKINQIEKALSEIDATRFHKLIDSYLNKKYSYLIKSNGTKIGEDKPIKGTPDSFSILNNGKYIFIEYTTQKTGVLNKFLEDLDKCFDESKTKISVKNIEMVILACNLEISLSDIDILKKKCKQHNTQCQIFTNSMLANDLNNHYPTIVKDFLNIEVDTNQILDYEDFIKDYDSCKYTTSLNTSFNFRENEITIFNELLENNQFVFITGNAGIGKTKFALEECKRYSLNNGYEFKAILNKGLNLFDDMKANFSDEKNYLILIDDVNRVKNVLDYIQTYYAEKINDDKIKIVGTLRDYAKKSILEKIPQSIKKKELELKPFTEQEITDIVKKEYAISNFVYLEQIIKVSRGNPRLALMAAKVAKETNSIDSIYDVTTIYDEYFKEVNKDISIAENNSLLTTIIIISFFRVIDKSHEEQMLLIEKVFNISLETFWKEVERLDNLEIVDLHNNNIVKISDQILSTYLFYKIVFIDKKIEIYTILDNFFPLYKQKLIDTLSPLFQTFNSKNIISELQKPIDQLWGKYINDEENLLLVMRLFWFLKKIDILIYFKDKIENLTQEEFKLEELDFEKIDNNNNDNFLQILSLFANDIEYNTDSIELIINYLNKKPSKLSLVISVITKNYGYKYDSYMYDYNGIKALIDTLWNLSIQGKDLFKTKLFIKVCSYLIKTEFEDNKFKGSNYTMLFYKLYETNELKSLRDNILKKVFSLYENKEYKNDVLLLIKNYPKGLSIRYGISEIETWDSEIILNFITNSFDIHCYSECRIVQYLLESFDKKNITYNKNIREKFLHEDYKIEKILTLTNSDFSLNHKKQKIDYNMMDELRLNKLSEFTKDYTLENWEILFDKCLIIDKNLKKDYRLVGNLNNLFNILLNNDQKLFIKVLIKYLELGNPFGLKINMLNFINILGKDEVYSILNKYEYEDKINWICQFLTELPQEKITLNEVTLLLNIYTNSQSMFHYYLSHSIEKYMTVKPSILIDIIDIVVKKFDIENVNLLGPVCDIFNPYTDIFTKLEIYFKDNIQLFKRVYLLCFDLDNNFDFDCQALNKVLLLDNSFIAEFIKHIINKQNCNFSFYNLSNDFSILWDREDYKYIINKLFDTFLELREDNYIQGEFLEHFFCHSNNERRKEKINEIIIDLIKKYIQNEKAIILIFELISEFLDERRKYFVKNLLEINTSFKLFDKLQLESHTMEWEGSKIPKLEKSKEFYKSLLELFVGIDFLQHAQRIQNIIQIKEDEIKEEKKKDFMRDS